MAGKANFFETWSWFQFNNVGLALRMVLEFCASLGKWLKLKFREFWGLIPMFVEVTGENLVVGSLFAPPILTSAKVLQFSTGQKKL